MSNAIKNIMNQLETVFADLDNNILVESGKWAFNRRAKVFEFLDSDEAKEMTSTAKYLKAFDIAGGKTWYNILTGNNDEMLQEWINKNHKLVIKKRNHSIANKLEKVGVTEVISDEMSISSNGFTGCYVVKTDKGNKRVTIEVISAGGYNVQCFHLRTLVKIK